MPSFQGVYVQNEVLSGVAIPYPKVRQSAAGMPQQDAAVQTWFTLWGVPYVHRFPNPQVSSLIAHAEWTRLWQWGGAPPG
jgi:hypothetical protein